jgi:hypothetical protein
MTAYPVQLCYDGTMQKRSSKKKQGPEDVNEIANLAMQCRLRIV